MRITNGYGSGGQGPSGGWERSDPQAFKRGRRAGQIVRGRLLAPGPGGLFWVVVAGHKLLARLEHEPVPGVELVFRIERLEPELVLKDITPRPGPGSDPALLLAALTEARSRFERRLSALCALPVPPPLDLTTARRRFAAFLAEDATARTAYAAVGQTFALAAARLPARAGRLRYTPWMFPGLGQSELLASRLGPDEGGPGWTLRLFGSLDGAGLAAAVATWHPGRVAYRLMLEHPGGADALLAALGPVLFGRTVLKPACMNVGPLPPELASGFLARQLAATDRPFTGLRLRV